MLFQLPRDCRVYTQISPSNQWGWAEIFANKTNHLLELLLWQNAAGPKNKARHKAAKPKPFIPEFMKQPAKPSEINNGVELHTAAEIDAILAQARD